MTRKVVSIILLGMLSGCVGFKPFQPPPSEYEMWKKQGVDALGTQKALLECGYPDPFNSGKYRQSLNDGVLSDLCLQADGFEYNSDRQWRPYTCPKSVWGRIPACVPGASAPSRSAAKRFNSPFCKKLPKAPVCQP